MNFRSLQRLQFKEHLPLTLDQAWDFFSNPRNLAILTPPSLNFQILDPETLPPEIYAGLIICYKVQPLPLIKNLWVTEITHMENKKFFVDEQRFGPYAFWHHQHHFRSDNQGVVMEDIIHYKLPGKFLGNLFLGHYVRNQIQNIFSYRAKKMGELF